MRIRSLPMITHLSNLIAQSFRTKILLVTVIGVLIGILLTATVSFIGLHRLADKASDEIEAGLNTVIQEYLEYHIEDTTERINLWMGHAQADLRILADITQTLIDHREEFRPMTEALADTPFFADKMQYYPEGGYSQNTPDEPSVVMVQTIYHDENGHITPYPQQIIAETALLDLVMPAIHSQGARKMWTYFTGDPDASFIRGTPWIDYGRDAVKTYPEVLDMSYWDFWPGLVEAFQAGAQNSDLASVSSITGFVPYVDGPTGELVQTFAYPLWNQERTRFAGAVWYDLSLNDIIGNIEGIELAETGFAFLAQADGNLLAIPERGITALGMEGAAYFDEDKNLYRYLQDSGDPAIAALALPQDNESAALNLQLATGEFVLIMRKLSPMHTFSQDSQHIEREAWILGFVVPKDEIYAPLIAAQTSIHTSSQRILTDQVLVFTATILIFIGLIYLATGQMTGDLVKLSDGARQIMQANYDTQVTIHSRDEFGKLGVIFNDMASQLKSNFERIEQQNRELSRGIQERQQAEAGLMYERYLLHTLMNNSPDHIYFKDARHRFIRVNNAIVDWFGMESHDLLLGKTDFDFFSDEHARQAHEDEQNVMRSGQSVIKREKETWPDGRVTWVSTTKSPLVDERGGIIGTFGISRDISDQVRTEEEITIYSERLQDMVDARTQELREIHEELIRKEKMAVLGQLAGAMGHELRNPLGVIANATYLLRAIITKADDTVTDYLTIIETEVTNASGIINELLEYVRVQSAERQAVPVSTLVNDMFERHPVPEHVVLVIDIPKDLPPAFVNPDQIEQVLLNLVANAYQAMPEGGTLSVSSYQCSVVSEQSSVLSEQSSVNGEDAPDGTLPTDDCLLNTEHCLLTTDDCSLNTEHCLQITIRDTGTGIAPENIDHIFEPLFTTKARGMGLGLALARNLAEANGGRIDVESEAGKGSTFTVILPAEREYHAGNQEEYIP